MRDNEKYNLKSLTKYATGCCFCMRYNDFKEIGGFDENFPMYSEDVDLSLTIRKQGNEVWYVPESIIWHKVSASIGGSFSLSKNMKKIRGLFLLFKKHANPFQYLSIILLRNSFSVSLDAPPLVSFSFFYQRFCFHCPFFVIFSFWGGPLLCS